MTGCSAASTARIYLVRITWTIRDESIVPA